VLPRLRPPRLHLRGWSHRAPGWFPPVEPGGQPDPDCDRLLLTGQPMHLVGRLRGSALSSSVPPSLLLPGVWARPRHSHFLGKPHGIGSPSWPEQRFCLPARCSLTIQVRPLELVAPIPVTQSPRPPWIKARVLLSL